MIHLTKITRIMFEQDPDDFLRDVAVNR